MVELWKQRLTLPHYRVADAARFAGTTPQTLGRWQAMVGQGRAVAARTPRKPLSYLELIEVGVVSAMRKAGVKLAEIRKTRDFMERAFGSKFPFAEYKFKTDGARLLVEAEQVDPAVREHLLETATGQLAWNPILAELLRSFDYPPQNAGPVQRWKLKDGDVPIIIDPRISFGDPTVRGIPTWIIQERWKAEQDIEYISEDFGLTPAEVEAALAFENIGKGRTIH